MTCAVKENMATGVHQFEVSPCAMSSACAITTRRGARVRFPGELVDQTEAEEGGSGTSRVAGSHLVLTQGSRRRIEIPAAPSRYLFR